MPATEIEITSIPPLGPGEATLVDQHTILNLASVLDGELTLLGIALADDPDLLRASLAVCGRIRQDLMDPAASLSHAASLPDYDRAILREVEEVFQTHPAAAQNAEVRESAENIRSVLKVFAVRAQELLARAQAPGQWVEMPIDALRADFMQVFAAIEKNSRGRYRIIYNLALQEPADYYVDFVIDSESARSVSLPLVFKDVMRDLLANARKYTRPGGTINAGLHETRAALRFSVQDTGCGIPPGELETVVHYGKRGSNVAHVRTMGGGFGLTKAFLVTKQFGGRFWIRSELGVGTRIRIEIPRKVEATD